MSRLANTLINTVCHIIIDGQAQEKFYLITHLIMLLQTIACIADPSSLLFKMVQWADPSTYLDPAFSIILCLVIIVVFSLFIVVKLIITEADEMLVKPNTLKIYMGNILLHMQMLCKTSVLAPLIRATLLEIQSPGSSSSEVAGIVALSIYLLFLLPLSLYNTSNTFILTPQLNKKLTYINIYMMLNIFRIPFAILAPVSQSALVAVATLFFIVFLSISIKQPIFAYSHERPLKGMISAIAFTCLMRLCQAIQSNSQQSLLLQLVGMVSFICLIDWVSQFRVRKILELPRPTVHQIKILVFLISNIKEYFQKLEYFIIRHHRRCCNPECACSSVISHVSSKGKVEGEYDDIIWYRFMIDYIQQFYSLAEMQTLAQSEMKLRIQKYQYIVIDLAEMYLFKLGHVNEAYYIVNNYRHLLETRGINFLSFRQKKKIINYYLQQNISIKYHTEGVINLNGDNFMNFQIAFEKYRKTLLRTAKSTGGLWQEMGKREPDGEKIKRWVHILQKWHSKIRQMYQDITSSFQKSAEILQKITKDYYENVLNISAKSPFHVIETPKFENILAKGEEKVEKISENMQAFSYNSETPMCFVAVDEEKFGHIVGCNAHFNRVMSLQFGKLAKIEEFMVPEMRKSHEERMKEFIRGDTFNLQHKNGFTVNLRGKIVYTKILVQIMPSIIEGLRYVFFLKKLMPRKKIVGLKNYQAIGYTSQSFDDAFEGRGRREKIMHVLQEQGLSSLRERQEIKIEFEEREIFVRYMHEFSESDISWLFVEFYEQEDVLMETKYNLMGERTNDLSNAKKTSDGRSNRKDSVISRDSGYELQKSNMEKSDLQQKMAAQKMKKTEQGIKSAYEIIIDDKKKNISNRVIIFTVVMILVLLGILIATVLVKLSNQNTYLNTISINSAFNNFIMTVSKAVYSMKMLNFYAYSNNTYLGNVFFGNLASNVNITSAMDQLVVNFEISAITQTWNTYTCSTNSSFIVATENNFLTVSDFIQNPITNLLALPVTSFKFAPNLAAQTFPLPSNQCLYFQFMVNTLYVSIPGFLKLKSDVMDGILLKSVGASLPMLLLFASVILLTIVYVVGKVRYNKCITALKNETYDLFQSLQRELIMEKENNCKEFINKYTLIGSNERIDDFNQMSEHSNSFRTEGEENMTHSKVDRSVDEHTERELEVTPQAKSEAKISNFIQSGNQKEGKKIKAGYVFNKQSIYWIVIKYSLIALPFFLFAVIFGAFEYQEATGISNAIKIQSKIQMMQQNINLVINYAMQHGTEDNQYSQQLNLPNFLNSLISQIYEIQRSFVSQSLDFSALPQVKNFLDEIGYSNICKLPDVKFPSYLLSGCPTLSQSVLTKGFYSSLISYLEQLSTLMIAYPTTTNLTLTQRMAYLGNPLFTSHAVLLHYFDIIIQQFLTYFQQDFTSMIKSTTNVLLYANIGIIVGVGFLGILLELHFIRVMKREILEIKSLFLLISYESIMKDEGLKNRFYARLEEFKKLK